MKKTISQMEPIEGIFLRKLLWTPLYSIIVYNSHLIFLLWYLFVYS